MGGLTQLRQEFNPVWFIPQESYLASWFNANEKYFPKEGEKVEINIAQVDFSTFLAFILTASSTSHVFSTFFKIFFLVALFGMYHALIFLPVLLSIFGFCLHPHSEKDNTIDVEPVNDNVNPATSTGVDNKEFVPDNKH